MFPFTSLCIWNQKQLTDNFFTAWVKRKKKKSLPTTARTFRQWFSTGYVGFPCLALPPHQASPFSLQLTRVRESSSWENAGTAPGTVTGGEGGLSGPFLGLERGWQLLSASRSGHKAVPNVGGVGGYAPWPHAVGTRATPRTGNGRGRRG